MFGDWEKVSRKLSHLPRESTILDARIGAICTHWVPCEPERRALTWQIERLIFWPQL